MTGSKKLKRSMPPMESGKNNFNENLPNDATSDALKKEIRKNIDLTTDYKTTDDSDKSASAFLNNLTDQHKEFITKCKEKLDSSSLPMDFDQWTLQEQYDHLINNINKYFPNIPESLRFVLPAIFKDGDCGRPANERPDWLDMDKFYRGQQFALRYFTGVALSGLMSLLMIFNFADGLKPLILSQKSNTPYRAFKRYLSTNRRFRNWYTSNPWHEGTQAYRDIQTVRGLHRNMREKLCKISDDQIDRESEITRLMCPAFKTIAKDFEETCPKAKSWHQCPYTTSRMKGLNQGDMAGTQFAIMGLIVLYPEQFGVHNASEEDLEAFCHLWRGLGYLLGIEDQYNFCRGSLQDVRRRAEDFIEFWVKPNFPAVTAEWEHMSICVFEGTGFIALFKSYKVFLLYLCNVLKLNMPGLYKSLSWSETIMYWALKCVFFLLKFPDVSRIMNAIFHKDLNRATDFKTEKHDTLKKKSSKIIQEFVVAL